MTRRHKHVINMSEIEPVERVTGSQFGFKAKIIWDKVGARGIGSSLYEIPPGRACFPYHFHCANEEAMYVLEGEGTIRIGPDRVKVGPGDWITFPIGPAAAHQVINTGTVPLRFLALSTKANAEVVGYPDSKKIGVNGSPPGAGFDDPPWIRLIAEETAMVEYFKGEKID
jgi:uncharacterized cupin superfamily protein